MARRGRAILHIAAQLEQHGAAPVAITRLQPWEDGSSVEYRFADHDTATGADELLRNGPALSVFYQHHVRSGPEQVRVLLAYLD